MLIQKSAEFNIELNAKDGYGKTAFHVACESCNRTGNTTTVNKMMENAVYFGFDLKAKDNFGRTGFQIAKYMGHTSVARVIETKMPSIAK